MRMLLLVGDENQPQEDHTEVTFDSTSSENSIPHRFAWYWSREIRLRPEILAPGVVHKIEGLRVKVLSVEEPIGKRSRRNSTLKKRTS